MIPSKIINLEFQFNIIDKTMTIFPGDLESKKWLMANLSEFQPLIDETIHKYIGAPFDNRVMVELKYLLLDKIRSKQITGSFQDVKSFIFKTEDIKWQS